MAGVWGNFIFALCLLISCGWAVRDTLGTAIYFMVYESGKQLGTTFAGDNPNSNKLAVVAAGGLCGLVSWAMICEFSLEAAPGSSNLKELSPQLTGTIYCRPNRLGKEHLPEKRPSLLTRTKSRAGAENRIP